MYNGIGSSQTYPLIHFGSEFGESIANFTAGSLIAASWYTVSYSVVPSDGGFTLEVKITQGATVGSPPIEQTGTISSSQGVSDAYAPSALSRFEFRVTCFCRPSR
jgi:hypothetical protein